MATRIIFRTELFAAVIFLTATSFAAEVRFEDNGAALINPGRGWTMHYELCIAVTSWTVAMQNDLG